MPQGSEGESCSNQNTNSPCSIGASPCWWEPSLLRQTLAAAEADGPRTGEKAILAALEEKADCEFIDEPLSTAVDYFKQVHNIEILVDTKALEDVNLGTDTPVNKRLSNIKFRSALNLILHDLDLTWMIADEVLIITTPEEAELHLVTRVYDVGRLVTVQDPEGKRWQDFDSLIRAITRTIVSESWEDVGGPGSMAEFEYQGAVVLIVRQTLDIHEQLARLLEDLTKVADQYGDDAVPVREKKKPQPPAPGMGGGGVGGMGGGAGGFF